MHKIPSDVYTGSKCAAFKALRIQTLGEQFDDQNNICIILLTINSNFRNLFYRYTYNCTELFTEALFVRGQDWK